MGSILGFCYTYHSSITSTKKHLWK